MSTPVDINYFGFQGTSLGYDYLTEEMLPTVVNSPDTSDTTSGSVDTILPDLLYTPLDSNSSTSYVTSPDTTAWGDGPWLEIVEQPSEIFRFRYLTESQGTPHGPVMGENSVKSRKTFPTVRLHNWNNTDRVVMRCWLFTADDPPKPHVHNLVAKAGSRGINEEPHCITASCTSNYTAVFENLVIIHAVRKLCYEPYIRKREKCGAMFNKKKELAEIKEEIKSMNMNVVRLYFEALAEIGGELVPICSAFSREIKNKKNTEFGDLKIVRSDRRTGSCRGDEEVFIFVEKVAKDVKIKFFKEDCDAGTSWEAYASFRPTDIHHMVAIAFRTPPYKDKSIESNVTVEYQLVRPSDKAVSNSMQFVYTPDPGRYPLKRPRVDVAPMPDSTQSQLGMESYIALPDIADDFDLNAFINCSSLSLTELRPTQLPACLEVDGVGDETSEEESAIEAEKLDKLRLMVSEGRDLVCTVTEEVLRLASEEVSDTKLLLVAFSRVTPDKLSALHWAVRLKMHDELDSMTEIALAFGLQSALNQHDSSLMTPLQLAVRMGDDRAVARLLYAGADASLYDRQGFAAVHSAILRSASTLAILLKGAAPKDLFLPTRDGVGCLELAVSATKVESATLLLNAGLLDAEPPSPLSGDTVLHTATALSHLGLTALLLEAGADLEAENFAGKTPLHIAVANDDVEVVKLQLKYGVAKRLVEGILADSKAVLSTEMNGLLSSSLPKDFRTTPIPV